MKRFVTVAGLALLLIGTLVNGGFLALSLLRPAAPSAGRFNTAIPRPSLGVKSVKQHDVDTSKQGTRLATGDYKVTEQTKSRIEATQPGKLVLASNKQVSASFVLAVNDQVNFTAANVNDGWQTQTVADDPLWAPGACSSKPTLLLQGRYIFIDDGKTRPSDTYNSYLMFDITTGVYSYFGGDNFTDTQAKAEKILLADNENDQLVFYIDRQDPTGPLTHSTAFKHARGDDHGNIIRRVIDPKTMQYTDYALSVKAPADMPYFYLSAANDPHGSGPTISLTGDNPDLAYDGTVASNSVTLVRHTVDLAVIVNRVGPFDTPLEQELDDPLSRALPEYSKGPLYDKKINATRFSIDPIAAHGSLQFLVATQRTGDGGFTSPVVYDKSHAILQPLTNKAFLNFDNNVVLGVF